MNMFLSIIRNYGSVFLRAFSASLLASALILVWASLSRPNAAEAAGTPHDEVVKILGERHAEASVAYGLASNGGLIEVFTTADGATWTIILTMPNGMSVVVGSGEAWIRRQPKLGRPS